MVILKKDMNMNVDGTITDNEGTVWIENDLGFYAVDGTTLFFGYDMNEINDDSYVEVSDLTDLTTEEYNELASLLFDVFHYQLNGKFL